MRSSKSNNTRVVDDMVLDVDRFVVAGASQVVRWVHLGLTGPFGDAPGTPRRTGEAAAGWAWGINSQPSDRPTPGGAAYPSLPVSVVDSMMRTFKVGDTVYGRNRVPHAAVLAGGRRFSPAAGRTLGSVQAPGQPPQDFFTLAVQEPIKRLPSWRYAG